MEKNKDFSEYCENNFKALVFELKRKVDFLEGEVKHLKTMDKIQTEINEAMIGYIKVQNRKI